MESWMINWGVILAAGGGLAAYYASTGKPKAVQNKAVDISELDEKVTAPAEKRKQPKSALRKEASPAPKSKASGADSKEAKKRNSHQKTPSVSFTQDTAAAADDDEEEDAAQDDKEWARQLAAAKQGVNLNAQAQSNKPKKQSKKKQAAAEQNGHINGSVNGASTAGSVADMLEPTPAGPSSIRITGEEKAKKAQPAKAAPEKETKKQRQNRRKAEEAKAQREADEQQRKKLEEQQRRSAREARGEPAKNGLGAAPASSAWNGSNGAAPTSSQAPLFDTFEPVQAVKAVDVGVNGAASAIQTPVADASQMSEEKQIELIQEMSGWNEVSTKKSKRTRKDAESITTNSPPPEAAEPAAAPKAANKFASVSTSELVGGKKNVASRNAYAALEKATNFTSGPKGHPQDSDWAAN